MGGFGNEVGSGSSVNLLSLASLVGAVVLLAVIRYWKEIQEYLVYRKKLLEVSAALPGKAGFPLIGNGHEFLDSDLSIVTLKKMAEEINATTFRVWLGPIMKVIVTDPRDIGILIGSSKAAEKDTVYDFMKPAVINALINGSGPIYRAHKKLMVPLINGSNPMSEHIKQFNFQSKKMIDRLQKKVGTGEYDIHNDIVVCVADIVFETIFGVPGKAQDGHENILIVGTEIMLHLLYKRMMTIWMYPDAIFYRTHDGRKLAKMVHEVHTLLDSIVAKKKKELLDLKEQGIEPDTIKSAVFDQVTTHVLKTKAWADEDIRYEMLTLFIGSHDTISGLSCFTTLLLAMFPDVQVSTAYAVIDNRENILAEGEAICFLTVTQSLPFHQKVRDEVRQVIGDHDISEEDTTNLKYLDMVIREVIRLFPVGPILGRKITADLKLETCTLPKGASVFILPFATHRDARYWKDPEKFMPERFLPENSKDRPTWAFVPFSGGQRSCPGNKYGMVAVKLIIANLVRNFQLETTRKFENMKIHAHISTRAIDGYHVSLQKLRT